MPSPSVSRTAAGLPRKQPAILTIFQTRLPVDLRWAMERRAAAEGVSLSRLAQEALRSYLAEPEDEAPATRGAAEPSTTRAAIREPE